MAEFLTFVPENLLNGIAGSILDILVYTAIGAVTLIGFFKCVFPVRTVSRELRRAVRKLEKGQNNTDENGRPEWQSPSFLGKRLEGAWRRFLANAKQLDARGLTCDVSDYINDDTTIFAVGHAPLAEVIPSLLTSLGILGTFIGLASGLGKLEISGSNMMETIPEMINGMSFAFMTSIVGVACSLCFNIINRMVSGGAVNAIDDFQDAFSGIVMQRPVEDSVRMIIQQEDQAKMLRSSIGDLSERVADGVSSAVRQSLDPVAMNMNHFIAGQTQAQIDGLNAVMCAFVEKMNSSMGSGLLQLGQTLSRMTGEQQLSVNSLNESLATAGRMLEEVKTMQNMTERVGNRLEKMLGDLETDHRNTGDLLLHGSQVLTGMMNAAQEQGNLISALTDSQRALENSMRDYGQWSQRTLDMIKMQAENASRTSGEISGSMEKSAEALRSAYTGMVGSFAEGMTRSMGLFDNSVKALGNALSEAAEKIEKDLRNSTYGNSENAAAMREFVTGMAGIQKTIGDFRQEFALYVRNTAEEKHA